MNDEKKAIEALRKLASYKLEKSGVNKKLEDKAKLKLGSLGISPESAAKSAALMKIITDASQGKMGHDFGDFDVEGQITPEERRVRLGWNKRF